jgi:hypothetical protein
VSRRDREALNLRNKRRAESVATSERRSRSATLLNELPRDKSIDERINAALTTAEQESK